MTVREFMFAADALRLEEGIEFRVPGVDPGPTRVPSPEQNRARNDQAMAQFQAMMGGVQKRGRRR